MDLYGIPMFCKSKLNQIKAGYAGQTRPMKLGVRRILSKDLADYLVETKIQEIIRIGDNKALEKELNSILRKFN